MFVKTVAVFWSLFQLSAASWLLLDSRLIRIIHLGFALVLVFSLYSFRRKKSLTGEPLLNNFTVLERIINSLLIMTVLVGLCYLLVNPAIVIFRSGDPLFLDILIGLAFILILLEACRRVIGPALSITALFFLTYLFLGSSLPSFLAFKGASLSRIIGQTYLTNEGVFGTPLDVSANVVFLFVLFGAFLEKTGGGQFFIRLALTLVGHFKGGPAKAAVIASGLTGIISGSSIANIVTTGTFTIPLMKKVGYSSEKAAAIEVAASTDGQIMPPIMGAAAFIMAAMIPNVSYVDVIIAASIPSFVSYITLFYVTHIEATKANLKGIPKKELESVFIVLKSGIHFLIPIFLLLYQLVIQRSSAGKAAFFSIISMVVLIIGKEFFQKSKQSLVQKCKNILKLCIASLEVGSKNMVGVALATAGAGIIVSVVSLGLGGQVNSIIEFLSFNNIFLMLFLTAILSLFVGMGLPTTATYVVMASLTVPALLQTSALQGYQIPIISAHLFCFYFGILADDTPPVGVASYAASAISGSSPIATGLQAFSYDIRTAIIPFMFIFNPLIILHQISSVFQMIVIFLMTILASFSFVSVIQNFCLTKNKLLEGCLFGLASFVLFQPQIVSKVLYLGDFPWTGYCLGSCLFISVLWIQKLRLRTV